MAEAVELNVLPQTFLKYFLACKPTLRQIQQAIKFSNQLYIRSVRLFAEKNKKSLLKPKSSVARGGKSSTVSFDVRVNTVLDAKGLQVQNG